MPQYGLFNDESADYTEEEALEAGFYSRTDARLAIADRYIEEDGLTVHEIEEPEEGDDEEGDDEDDDEESVVCQLMTILAPLIPVLF